jgi:hypothetical protein
LAMCFLRVRCAGDVPARRVHEEDPSSGKRMKKIISRAGQARRVERRGGAAPAVGRTIRRPRPVIRRGENRR